MAEATMKTEQEEAPKAKRKRDTRKPLTFVYIQENKIVFGKHKTDTFSTDQAWKEYCEKHNIQPGKEAVEAIRGFHDPMEKKIRNPTRAELLKLAGFEQE